MIRTVAFIIAFCLSLNVVRAEDEKSIRKLRDALVALAPDVDPGEAEQVSLIAHTAARTLAREYGVVWTSGYQNLLIHMGKRQRGYCGHYVRDIGERLKKLRLKTLVLHWGGAFSGTIDENNGLVVTARNQPFADGILLDAWRHAGRLFWCPLKDDSAYDLRLHPPRRFDPPWFNPPYPGPTAWKEEPLYTAWLQDYNNVRKWQWQPGVP